PTVLPLMSVPFLFFIHDTSTSALSTLSLHERSSDLVRKLLAEEQLLHAPLHLVRKILDGDEHRPERPRHHEPAEELASHGRAHGDRKSTRLNSSHLVISYAVFCLKKKNKTEIDTLIM